MAELALVVPMQEHEHHEPFVSWKQRPWTRPRVAQEWTDLQLAKGGGKTMAVGDKVHLTDYHSRQGDFTLDGTKTGDHTH